MPMFSRTLLNILRGEYMFTGAASNNGSRYQHPTGSNMGAEVEMEGVHVMGCCPTHNLEPHRIYCDFQSHKRKCPLHTNHTSSAL